MAPAPWLGLIGEGRAGRCAPSMGGSGCRLLGGRTTLTENQTNLRLAASTRACRLAMASGCSCNGQRIWASGR